MNQFVLLFGFWQSRDANVPRKGNQDTTGSIPAVTAESKVDGYPIQMLVNTGSLQEHCWMKVMSSNGKELKRSAVVLMVKYETL